MATLGLLARRGPWGCQAPLAMEVCLEKEGTQVTQVSLALWA